MSEPVNEWQNRFVPLMSGMLIFVVLFFLSASIWQLIYLQGKINHPPTLKISDDKLTDSSINYERIEAVLELYNLDKRYHQGNMLLMSSIWIQYLGFITGMIMISVGSTFILGKLKESESTFNAETASGKLIFNSTSPGLFLALFGLIIICLTLFYRSKIDISDGPVYIRDINSNDLLYKLLKELEDTTDVSIDKNAPPPPAETGK